MKFFITIAALSFVIVASSVQAQQVTGAGATFPAPLYKKWGEQTRAAIGVELNYQPIGSGGGQNQILRRAVDFGASDAPMDPEKLVSGKLLQFPSVIGSVVVVVNIAGVETNKLKLTGELLADIYAGKITKWNAPSLVEANRGVNLPDVAITPIYRVDGSGTSYVYTSYLSAVSPMWKDKVGANTSVKWPVGVGTKGNEGVADLVRRTDGGVGYVEYAYASRMRLVTAQIRNKAGYYVSPTMESFAAAAANADWGNAKDFAVKLVDQMGDKSWPIESATYIELPKDPADAARSAVVMKFFDWVFKNGDDAAATLEYIALPEQVKTAVRAAWHATILGPDGKPIY